MKWCERILLMAWLGFCFAIMTEGTLWAGDCTSIDDCGSPPDNNSRAAVGGGALAGGGLAYRSHKKRKSGPPPANYPSPWVPGSRTQRTVTPDPTGQGGVKIWYRDDSTKGKWTLVPPLRSTQGDKPLDPQAYPSSGTGTKL